MIIGFDHITFNNVKFNYKEYKSYKSIFSCNIQNNKKKNKFLKKKNIKKHYLEIYTKNNFPTIEHTFHGKGEVTSDNIKIKKNKIILFVKNIEKEKKFLIKIGFKVNKNQISIISKIKKFSQIFSLQKRQNTKEKYLDDYGFTCVAIIVHGIDKFYSTLVKENLEITDIFSLRVKKKKLKIFFFRSPGKIIYEVIEYVKKNKNY